MQYTHQGGMIVLEFDVFFEYFFTDQVKSLLILTPIIIIIAVLVGLRLKKIKPNDKPPKYLVVLELIISTINGFLKIVIGRNWKKYSPYIFVLAVFLVFANLCGIFGLTSPTSSWNITLALALVTFVMIHYTGIKSNGIVLYVKSYFSPFFLFFPVNLIGEIAFPMSLSLRLFGNIMSGCVMSILVYGLISGFPIYIAILFLPLLLVLHMLFDIFFGFIQVLVFMLLSSVFIAQKVNEDELITE